MSNQPTDPVVDLISHEEGLLTRPGSAPSGASVWNLACRCCTRPRDMVPTERQEASLKPAHTGQGVHVFPRMFSCFPLYGVATAFLHIQTTCVPLREARCRPTCERPRAGANNTPNCSLNQSSPSLFISTNGPSAKLKG